MATPRITMRNIREILRLRLSAGLPVLSPVPYIQSWTSSLLNDIRDSITVLDDASPRNMNRHTIGYAQIGDFKALENEVVVLVDMSRPGHNETLRSLQYGGMSRARALLSMICS